MREQNLYVFLILIVDMKILNWLSWKNIRQ